MSDFLLSGRTIGDVLVWELCIPALAVGAGLGDGLVACVLGALHAVTATCNHMPQKLVK
jgi:hypothetical protein